MRAFLCLIGRVHATLPIWSAERFVVIDFGVLFLVQTKKYTLESTPFLATEFITFIAKENIFKTEKHAGFIFILLKKNFHCYTNTNTPVSTNPR